MTQGREKEIWLCEKWESRKRGKGRRREEGKKERNEWKEEEICNTLPSL